MKKCTKCDIEKPFDEFVKNKNTKSGINSKCKECIKQYSKERYKTHSHIWKEWSDNNKDKVKLSSKRWVENNPEKYKEYQKNYINKWSYNQYNNNLEYRLQKILRSRLYTSLKEEYKKTSSTKLIGCTLDQLKKHLEQQFTPEMNWENYGTYWEIDHIKQVNTFDLKYFENQQQCFYYTNLRPLEKIENRKRPKR
jgi:hypothetical protein